MTEPRVRIHIILEPLPDGVPWNLRVRRLLKYALRCLRLKNVHHKLLIAPPEPKPEEKPQ